MSQIFVIHENDAWTSPLRKELDRLGLPHQAWFLDRGVLDTSIPPPEGIFYNRMSASSHTRDHRFAPEYTACVLAWLERHGRRVRNGSRAMQLEISKAAQYAALNQHGIRTPATVLTVGRAEILDAARMFAPPFISKHNRGGKGLGVRLFRSFDALQQYVEGPHFEVPIDGVTLLQEYIDAPDATITRCEFVGGEFLYAVRVDTSRGFELCPADECQTGDSFCPAGESPKPRFEILPDFDHPILEDYRSFLAANGIQIAAIEFLADCEGRLHTYDVNINTNYNGEAERRAGVSGMRAVARYLGEELAREAKASCFEATLT